MINATQGYDADLSMPSDRKPLLFVSSTSDLVDERSAVADAINARSIEIYRYEEDSARGQSPKARLLKKLKSTDIYVGIFGAKYGSPYPEDDFDGAIVEWEFDTAMQQDDTEVLAFSKSTAAQSAEPRQRDFLQRIGDFASGVWLKQFADIDQFKIEVRNAVQDWSLQYWDKYADTDTSNSSIGTSLIAGIVGAGLMGIVWGVSAAALTIADALQLVAVLIVCGACGIFISNR